MALYTLAPGRFLAPSEKVLTANEEQAPNLDDSQHAGLAPTGEGGPGGHYARERGSPLLQRLESEIW